MKQKIILAILGALAVAIGYLLAPETVALVCGAIR